MNWRKSLHLKHILKKDIHVRKKVDEILLEFADNIREHEMDKPYQALVNDLILVRKTEDLDHVMENIYKWANENMIWIG